MWSDVQTQRYPVNLLNKDWSKRPLKYFTNRLDFVNKVHELEVYDDDVWLVTWAKCGTTWMQELLWLVMNNYDFETAKKEHLEVRTPFLEFDYIIHENLATAFQPVERLSRPRLIKSHLPLPLLPAQLWDKKPKLIYVARNIKDALVSQHYHRRSLGYNMDKTLDQHVLASMEDENAHEVFLHMTEFYALRHEPWLYYTSFERMKLDLAKVIRDVCQFLNKSISSDNMGRMLKHLSFEEMKKNPKTQHVWEFEQIRKKNKGPLYENYNFIRKGLVNGYKEELSAETIEKLDKWVDENLAQQNVTMDELLLLN